MKNWQRFEQEIAKRLNGIRHKRTNFGESDLDVETDRFVIECKFRKEFPDYLINWLEQAKNYIKQSDRVPILAWKSKNTRTDDALVVIRLKDFESILKLEIVNKEDYKVEYIEKILQDLLNKIKDFKE